MIHLVTGAASLVGGKLCERLLDAGHRVIGVDDYASGSFSNVARLVRDARFSFIEHDVAEPLAVRADAVFHLALPSSRRTCDRDPLRASLTGAAGTARILALAEECHARLVLATSDDRWGPGLRTAEVLVEAAVRTRRVDVRHVRIATPFAPEMSPEDAPLLASLVVRALGGDATCPELARDAATVRLAWAADAARVLERTMRHDLRLPPVLAPIWEITPMDLAALVAAAAGLVSSTIVPVAVPAAVGTPSPCGASSRGSRSQKGDARSPTLPETLPAWLLLGVGASVTLEAAVAETVARFAVRIAGGPLGQAIQGPRAKPSLAS